MNIDSVALRILIESEGAGRNGEDSKCPCVNDLAFAGGAFEILIIKNRTTLKKLHISQYEGAFW